MKKIEAYAGDCVSDNLKVIIDDYPNQDGNSELAVNLDLGDSLLNIFREIKEDGSIEYVVISVDKNSKKLTTWDVLYANGVYTYFVLSSVLLDGHCYHNSTSNRTIDGKTIYPNNYEYSDIREWLNNDFFNSAFALGDDYIQTKTVDNSAGTTKSSSNPYACRNTQDKVFLLSYKDYQSSSYGFSSSTSSSNTRTCKVTDWARASGISYSTNLSSLYNGYYWTRSPDNDYPYYVWSIDYAGLFNHNYYGDNGVASMFISVRPSLSISIV